MPEIGLLSFRLKQKQDKQYLITRKQWEQKKEVIGPSEINWSGQESGPKILKFILKKPR
jgi:hypothetical protein